MSQFGPQSGAPAAEVDVAVVTPTDRVRWGPILAGLFSAFSALAVLGVLGAAIAGTAYDPGDNPRMFGLGLGVWGMLSALIAFALGGWVAARSAAVRGETNGLLNGAMVWAVAIPLMAYLAASGAARVAETAAIAAGDAMQASATIQADARAITTGNGQTTTTPPAVTTDPAAQKAAANTSARAAWGTLIALLLGLAAAALGGYLGARGRDEIVADKPRTATVG
jgi:hypothetical protein